MSDLKRKLFMRSIEELILKVIRNSPPTIILGNWNKWENLEFTDRIGIKPEECISKKRICFSNKQSRISFMVIIYLMARIYKLLMMEICSTRRELYYEGIQIFPNQRMVDIALQIICCLLDCPPWDIGVMASSKGLVAGPLLIKTKNEEIIDCSSAEGTLIPHLVFSPITELRSTARYVLLIEKDATFQKFLSCDVLTKMNGSLLITGKGFPDVNTRILVRRLNQDLKLPVLALVDADPFGIAIMCVYKYGSMNMSRYSKYLVTPDIKWLGIHPSDMQIYNIVTRPLQEADILKLRSLLDRVSMTANKKILKEVQTLLHLGRKAEIEAMNEISPTYLPDIYIPNKIVNNHLY